MSVAPTDEQLGDFFWIVHHDPSSTSAEKGQLSDSGKEELGNYIPKTECCQTDFIQESIKL
jgi:hypothetical protein